MIGVSMNWAQEVLRITDFICVLAQNLRRQCYGKLFKWPWIPFTPNRPLIFEAKKCPRRRPVEPLKCSLKI
jgi:hypothetical protein